jgi:hypothetical protein
MSRVSGPLMSVDASGSFSPLLTFRTTKQGVVVVRRSAPGSVNASAPSSAQANNRALYAYILSEWQALTSGEKQTYNDRATPLQLSGWNLYLKEQLPITTLPGTDWDDTGTDWDGGGTVWD